MKTKVAMAISLAGVLAAGTAAALVNTRVLDGGSGAAVLDAAQVQDTSAIGAGTNPADATVAVNTPAAPSSPTQASYAVRDAGTVTLDTSNSSLSIVAVTPAAGWMVVQSESDGVNSEVKFQSATSEVEFHANLLYGVVTTAVEAHDLSGNPTLSGGGGEDDGFNGNAPQRNDDGGGDDD